jgi:hypothetical protein
VGFLERRRDRKLEKDVGPDTFAALKSADAKRRRGIAEGEKRADRQAAEFRRRAGMVERDDSPVEDPVLRGVVVFSISASVFALTAFWSAAVQEAESLQPDIVELAAALERDEAWQRALSVGTWAFASRYVAVNWPEEFDGRIAQAAAALEEQPCSAVVEAALFEPGDEGAMEEFNEETIEEIFTAAVGRPLASSESLDEAWALWNEARNVGMAHFTEQLDSHFPEFG